MDASSTVREFLQVLVSNGELNFFLVDPTAKAFLRHGCKTVGDLQRLEEASWASIRLPSDTSQKMRRQLQEVPKLEPEVRTTLPQLTLSRLP
jgi:hypothetical protein